MSDFRLLNFAAPAGDQRGDGHRPGVLVGGDTVLDLAGALEATGDGDGIDPSSTLTVLDAWDRALPVLDGLADRWSAGDDDALAPHARPLDQVRLMAPLLYTNNCFCAAANYTDHFKEMTSMEPPIKENTKPYFFMKSPRHTTVGPDEAIRRPANSKMLDWEAEIGVVIGRTASNVSEADALNYVAGYTIVNDLTVRDQMRREDWRFGTDWFRGKSFTGSLPMGPWITPAGLVPDLDDIAIKQWLDDELMQDSSSSFMFFKIPEQIAYLSEQLTLLPGDLIATGTPAGVGRPRGRFVEPGQTLTVEIEGLGTLRTPVEK